MKRVALVLGGSGRFGRHMAAALWNAGWNVRIFDRASDDLMAASRDADVIVYGWNPTYDKWEAELPGQTQAVIKAAAQNDAKVLLAGNVYGYGEGTGPLWHGDTIPEAQNTLGRLRREMEQTYRESDVSLLNLRSGDYLDTELSGNWFDRIMAKDIGKGKFAYPGDFDAKHAWAFLPDLAEIGCRLLEHKDLPRQLEMLVPGYTLSAHELTDALASVVGQNIELRRFQWWPVKILSLVSPMFRHINEMRYLWSMPHQLDGAGLEQWLPDFEPTPLEEALPRCAPVNAFLANRRPPKQGHVGLPVPPANRVPAR